MYGSYVCRQLYFAILCGLLPVLFQSSQGVKCPLKFSDSHQMPQHIDSILHEAQPYLQVPGDKEHVMKQLYIKKYKFLPSIFLIVYCYPKIKLTSITHVITILSLVCKVCQSMNRLRKYLARLMVPCSNDNECVEICNGILHNAVHCMNISAENMPHKYKEYKVRMLHCLSSFLISINIGIAPTDFHQQLNLYSQCFNKSTQLCRQLTTIIFFISNEPPSS